MSSGKGLGWPAGTLICMPGAPGAPRANAPSYMTQNDQCDEAVVLSVVFCGTWTRPSGRVPDPPVFRTP